MEMNKKEDEISGSQFRRDTCSAVSYINQRLDYIFLKLIFYYDFSLNAINLRYQSLKYIKKVVIRLVDYMAMANNFL